MANTIAKAPPRCQHCRRDAAIPLTDRIGVSSRDFAALSAGIMTDSEPTAATVRIKKYANRRLYNTASSSYVTLEHLCQMVKDGTEFVVQDAKSGDDITRSVLTQIIVEEEAKGPNLLPIGFLRQLIGFYGDSLQAVVPRYLEHSMKSFARNQVQMRKYLEGAFGGLFPFGRFEEMGKQNIAILESAMKMFAPFVKDEDIAQAGIPEPGTDSISELKSKLEAIQKQFDHLSQKRPD